MHEQYRPASAPLVELGSRPPRSSVVAVLLGGIVVDWGGTYVVSNVLTIVWLLFATGLSADPARTRAILESALFQLTYLAMGLLMSVAGGYVAALWARHKPIAHGLGAGVASGGFALLLSLSEGRTPYWLNLATPAFALLGGYLRQLQRGLR